MDEQQYDSQEIDAIKLTIAHLYGKTKELEHRQSEMIELLKVVFEQNRVLNENMKNVRRRQKRVGYSDEEKEGQTEDSPVVRRPSGLIVPR